MTPIEADIVVQSEAWRAHRRARATVRRALEAAFAGLPASLRKPATVVVALSDDGAVRKLNRAWRGKNKPTNVLSFPAPAPTGRVLGPRHLGDIVIACETVEREAEREGKPFAHHLSHLAVHGLLHLLGFDHEDEREAERMERRERAILATLGIPDPYADV